MGGKNKMRNTEPVCFWVNSNNGDRDIISNYRLVDYVNLRASFDKEEKLSRISPNSLNTFAEKYRNFMVPYNAPAPGSITEYFSDKDCAYGDRYIAESLRKLDENLEKKALEIAKQRDCDGIILDYAKTDIESEIRGGSCNFTQWFCKAKMHYGASTTAMLVSKISKPESMPDLKYESKTKPGIKHTIG